MNPERKAQNAEIIPDEDVLFENGKEAAIVPLTASPDNAPAPGETILPSKEETLGKSDFPALTELEKQPKLPEENLDA